MLRSLRSRFLAALLFVVIVPLTTAGLVVDRRVAETLMRNTFEDLGTVAVFKSQQLETWVRARQEDTVRPTVIPSTQQRVARLLGAPGPGARAAAARELQQILEPIRSRQGFGEMFLLDARNGRVLLSTDPEQEGKFKDDRPYFREGRKAPFTQHVYYSIALGKPAMTFSAPYRDAAGRTIAVLVGRVDLRAVDRLMAERAGLGRTGRSFLVNRFNYFVSDALGRGPDGWRPVWSEGVTRGLAGQVGTHVYQSDEGKRVVGAYRWLPDLGLALLVEVEHDEAMALVWHLRATILAALALAAGLAVVLSLVFAYQISRPLGRLVDAVRALGAGDLARRVNVAGSAEIDTLASAVNRMADNLLASRKALEAHSQTLEARVQERTAEAEARRRAAEALAEVGRRISQSLEPGEVGRLAVESLCRLVNAEMAVLYRLEAASGDLVLLAGVGPRVDWNEGLAKGTATVGIAVLERRPVTTPDLLDDARISLTPEARARIERSGYRAVLAVPVAIKDAVLGALAVGAPAGRVFSPEEIRLAQAFADQVAVALENARLFGEVWRARDFFASIAANSGDAILATDMHGLITYFSPGAEELFGYGSEEVLGRPVAEYFRGGLGEARAVMRRVQAEGRIRDCEIGFRARNGRWVETNAAASLLRDAQGTVIGTVGVAKDVTERKREEEVLRKLSSAIESTADAVFVTDRDSVIEYANPAFEELAGYAKGEAVGATPRILKSGEHEPKFYQTLWRALAAGEVVRRVFINKKKTGELFYEEKTITPIRDASGAITHFVSTGRDVTERRRAEERQAVQFAVTRILAESATFVEAAPRLLEAIGRGLGWDVGGLWRADPVAPGLRCEAFWGSPAALEARTRGTVLAWGSGLPGRACRESAPVWISALAGDPDDPVGASAAEAGLRAAFAFAIRVESEATGVLVFFSRDTRPRDDALLTLAADLGSQIDQFVGRERAEATLREREEEFRQAQKMDAIGQLAGGIAHDFNNLLTVINGRSQLMLRKLPADHPHARDLALIRRTGERAAQLTRQLLAFSRRQALRPEVLALNTIVEEMATMLRRLIGENIRLDLQLAPLLGWVQADPSQIEQIIMNLAVNAHDAMPQGGSLTIRIADVEPSSRLVAKGTIASGPHVLLEVADTGHGMDAETKARVFEPFFTTRERGRGTGLGLSTVYGIVEQSGGCITVDSEPGRGATFRVYLPRVDEPAVASPDAVATATACDGTETVLLVEDEDEVRALAREALETHGYRILEASGGEEAIRVSEGYQGRIHLLLTDMIMPGMSGPEVAERVGRARPDMRVLFVSGYTDDALFATGLLDEERPYLDKPFTPQALAGKVRAVLDAGRDGHRTVHRSRADG